MTRREAKGVLSTFKDRMEDLKRFYLHAAGFLATNLVFITINLAEPQAGPVAMLPIIESGHKSGTSSASHNIRRASRAS